MIVHKFLKIVQKYSNMWKLSREMYIYLFSEKVI